jgi:hypothetical protein
MLPYAEFRDLGMKSRVVMVIHAAVYVEPPSEEEREARALLKAQKEAAVEPPVVPSAVDVE